MPPQLSFEEVEEAMRRLEISRSVLYSLVHRGISAPQTSVAGIALEFRIDLLKLRTDSSMKFVRDLDTRV
jgi:hypothetical protein